jgi:hypothetical protein
MAISRNSRRSVLKSLSRSSTARWAVSAGLTLERILVSGEVSLGIEARL